MHALLHGTDLHVPLTKLSKAWRAVHRIKQQISYTFKCTLQKTDLSTKLEADIPILTIIYATINFLK